MAFQGSSRLAGGVVLFFGFQASGAIKAVPDFYIVGNKTDAVGIAQANHTWDSEPPVSQFNNYRTDQSYWDFMKTYNPLFVPASGAAAAVGIKPPSMQCEDFEITEEEAASASGTPLLFVHIGPLIETRGVNTECHIRIGKGTIQKASANISTGYNTWLQVSLGVELVVPDVDIVVAKADMTLTGLETAYQTRIASLLPSDFEMTLPAGVIGIAENITIEAEEQE
jgi:hypothetical protein